MDLVWDYLTDFADQSMLLPITLLTAPLLALAGWRRAAGAWVVAAWGSYALMAALKISFVSCIPTGWRSPSGHTMAAALVYGGLLRLLFPGARWVGPAAALFAILIGLSRVVLGAHSVQEALLGGLIGLLGLLLLDRLLGPPPAGWRRRRWLLLLPALAVLFRHGLRSGAEGWLQALGRRFIGPWLGCHRG